MDPRHGQADRNDLHAFVGCGPTYVVYNESLATATVRRRDVTNVMSGANALGVAASHTADAKGMRYQSPAVQVLLDA